MIILKIIMIAKQNYYSQALTVKCLILKLKKILMSVKILVAKKETLDFSNYSTKWKYYDDSNKLVIGKMKDKNGGVVVLQLKNFLDFSQRCIRFWQTTKLTIRK